MINVWPWEPCWCCPSEPWHPWFPGPASLSLSELADAPASPCWIDHATWAQSKLWVTKLQLIRIWLFGMHFYLLGALPSNQWLPRCLLFGNINSNCTGGPRSQPRCIFTATLWAMPLPDFFLWRLTDIMTPHLRKSDIPLRSHMTFCDQRSTWKVWFFFLHFVHGKVNFPFWPVNQSF